MSGYSALLSDIGDDGRAVSPDGGKPVPRRVSAGNLPVGNLPKKNNLKPGKPQVIKTGRQRKKTATRAKGGEFRAKTEKKRVYFCCISAEVEMETLHEGLKNANLPDWEIEAYTSVLHIYVRSADEKVEEKTGTNIFADEADTALVEQYEFNIPKQNLWRTGSKEVFIFDFGCVVFWGFNQAEEQDFIRFCQKLLGDPLDMEEFGASEDDMAYICADSRQVLRDGRMSVRIRENKIGRYDLATWDENMTGIGVGLAWAKTMDEESGNEGTAEQATESVAQVDSEREREMSDWDKEREKGDSGKKVKLLEQPADNKGALSPLQDKGHGSDHSPSQSRKGEGANHERERDGGGSEKSSPWLSGGGHIYLENDVYTVSKYAHPRERLALSFAMAQSSILAVFEARIQKKVEEFRYIPETFATNGKVRISGKRLGNMIGEVFVVRHDVNLHTEILDTPDWFWNNRDVEDLYKMVSEYLEMDSRTAILNKRLDMLREMLTMLQLQNENEHAVKLEWIVILLIAISIGVEIVTVIGKYLNYWK